MRFRVAPHPASSSCTGDGSSSFLESRILWRSLPSESPGCPESPLLQSRLPMSLRVAPNPASSGCADGESPGCPESSAYRLVDLRVAPALAPSSFPGVESSGCPESSPLPAPPVADLRVAPILHSFGHAVDGSPGFPGSRILRLHRIRVFGFPRILLLRLGR